MIKKRLWRAASVGVLTLGVVTYSLADTFPGAVGPNNPDTPDPNDQFMVATDGPYVTSCWNDSGSAPAELNDHISYVNGTVASQTNLVMELGSCDTYTTDMRFDDNLTSGTLMGLATCLEVGGDLANNSTATNVECERWQIQINPSKIASSCGSSSSYKRANWCHESGHGLGLGHEDSCMNTGCTTSSAYSTHHITAHLASL